MTPFLMTFTVKEEQTEGGRLEHIATIELLKKTRVAFLESHDMKEDCIVPGIGFVIGDLNVKYDSAAMKGDKLSVSLSISDISDKKCVLLYQIIKQPNNQLIALCRTTIIFIDVELGKTVSIPEKFLNVLKSNEDKASHSFMMSRL